MSNLEHRIIAFQPVAFPESRVLILGSMPSVESLNQGFYYAHPRNAFWRIMADVFHAPFPDSIPERVKLLEKNGVALWDVLESCERKGSLDSQIREPKVNDFAGLFAHCPGIHSILFNGSVAGKLFIRNCPKWLEGRIWSVLPSTSPAYTLSYKRKLERWRNVLI